jgi:hypothetical protein
LGTTCSRSRSGGLRAARRMAGPGTIVPMLSVPGGGATEQGHTSPSLIVQDRLSLPAPKRGRRPTGG